MTRTPLKMQKVSIFCELSPAMPRGQTSEASLAEWHCVVEFLLEGWGLGGLQHAPPYRPGHANSKMASTSPVAPPSPKLQAYM